MTNNITHVLFDLDGTLVNTTHVLTYLLRDNAKSYGKVLSKDIEYEIPNIISPMDFINKYYDFLDLQDVKNDRGQMISEFIQLIYSQQFLLIPGVERLVEHLHQQGIAMAIATNNSSRHLAKIKTKVEPFLTDGVYFMHSVCGLDDPGVVLKKPHPDIYHVCVQRFPTPPKSYDNVLIVEDSRTGIVGALASGMKTLLINDQTLDNFDDIFSQITVVCNTFDEFIPESVGLPSYNC